MAEIIRNKGRVVNNTDPQALNSAARNKHNVITTKLWDVIRDLMCIPRHIRNPIKLSGLIRRFYASFSLVYNICLLESGIAATRTSHLMTLIQRSRTERSKLNNEVFQYLVSPFIEKPCFFSVFN